MTRLAAALAATALATGCWIDGDECTGTVTVEWRDFLASDGRIVSCGGAGIDVVDVFVDGQPTARLACADGGVTVTGVAPGPHRYTVEGVQAADIRDPGAIVNREEFTTDAGCGDRFVLVRPAAGVANLFYSSDAVGCLVDTANPAWPNCFLFFSVLDAVANTVTGVTKASPEPVKRLFPYPLDVEIELPAGPHVVQWMELVSAGTYAPIATSCSPAGFEVRGGETTFTPDIPLAAGGPACH